MFECGKGTLTAHQIRGPLCPKAWQASLDLPSSAFATASFQLSSSVTNLVEKCDVTNKSNGRYWIFCNLSFRPLQVPGESKDKSPHSLLPQLLESQTLLQNSAGSYLSASLIETGPALNTREGILYLRISSTCRLRWKCQGVPSLFLPW